MELQGFPAFVHDGLPDHLRQMDRALLGLDARGRKGRVLIHPNGVHHRSVDCVELVPRATAQLVQRRRRRRREEGGRKEREEEEEEEIQSFAVFEEEEKGEGDAKHVEGESGG